MDEEAALAAQAGLDAAVRIGGGGQAAVYRAVKRSTGMTVAVKVIHASPTERDRRLFAREVAVLADVSSHPNIVTLLDAGTLRQEGHDRPYLVMEHFDQTLSQHVGQLSQVRVALIGFWLAGALRFAHKLGIIHRDVKPGNVLLSERDGDVVPYLCDFGISYLTGVTTEGTTPGSQGFVAPDALLATKPAPGHDVYSLGATLCMAAFGALDVPTNLDPAWSPLVDVIDHARAAPERRWPMGSIEDQLGQLAYGARQDERAEADTLISQWERIARLVPAASRNRKDEWISNESGVAVERVRALREARNGLAHKKPVDPEDVRQLLRTAAQISVGLQITVVMPQQSWERKLAVSGAPTIPIIDVPTVPIADPPFRTPPHPAQDHSPANPDTPTVPMADPPFATPSRERAPDRPSPPPTFDIRPPPGPRDSAPRSASPNPRRNPPERPTAAEVEMAARDVAPSVAQVRPSRGRPERSLQQVYDEDIRGQPAPALHRMSDERANSPLGGESTPEPISNVSRPGTSTPPPVPKLPPAEVAAFAGISAIYALILTLGVTSVGVATGCVPRDASVTSAWLGPTICAQPIAENDVWWIVAACAGWGVLTFIVAIALHRREILFWAWAGLNLCAATVAAVIWLAVDRGIQQSDSGSTITAWLTAGTVAGVVLGAVVGGGVYRIGTNASE